jgi:YVTN family beta-propeller protein
LAAGAAAVAVAIVGVVIASGGSSAKHTPTSPSGQPSGQSATGHTTQPQPLSGAIPVGNSPDGLAPAGKTNFLWVANAGDGTIMRINEVTRAVSNKFSFASQSNPYAPMVYWQGYLWVGDFSAGTVEQMDPATGMIRSRIPVGGQPYAMTVAPNLKNGPPGNLWIASYNNDTIAFIKPGSTSPTVISGLGSGPKRMAESGTTLFVANQDDGKVTKVDALTGTLLGTIPVGGHPIAINYDKASGDLWVVDSQAGWVKRFNVASGTPTGSPINVGRDPKRLTSGGHYMWIANSGDGTVTRINAVTGQADPPIHVGGHPDAITATNKLVWVALWAQRTPQYNGPAGGVRLIDEVKGNVLPP